MAKLAALQMSFGPGGAETDWRRGPWAGEGQIACQVAGGTPETQQLWTCQEDLQAAQTLALGEQGYHQQEEDQVS